MFKKPLGGLKTSAPLRSSDRRKLKQRIITSFHISSEDGDLLVPDGILSVKFITHLDEPGIAYLSPDGDPLWFSVGKGSDDLIPTTYSLWKRRELLPFLSTPPAVIPVLIGGADLMIPGVIHHASALQEGQLVSILECSRDGESVIVSPPLAVGRMALPSDQLRAGGREKGKAVHVIHTWKDYLWEMGSKGDVPGALPISSTTEETAPTDSQEDALSSPIDTLSNLTILDPPVSEQPPTLPSYTPQEVTTILHTSMLQAISESIPASSFPIPATAFYTNYILPSRPAFPASVLPPSEPSAVSAGPSGATEITIKTSSHKSLTTFLKAAEKASILNLKAPQKHSQQPELLITSVNELHPSVAGHHLYGTVRDIEEKAARHALREKKESQGGLLAVTELWKPHQASLNLFKEMGGDPTTFYSLTEVKDLINAYITSKSLVNPHNQAYINLDQALITCLSAKSAGKSRDKGTESEPSAIEFVKREELTKKILEKMQSWHEVRPGQGDIVRRKGALKPIQVAMKVRQGRKVCTLISGFEPYLVVDAEDMAEELRKVCAGATSVSPVPGKPANAGLEVLVQGKQWKAVVEYLIARGIPKKWIEVLDLSGKK